jgi:hypothetical protein
MYLATEYLIRSGIAKRMLRIPCSLFLTDLVGGEKKVITISHGYRLSDRLVVKHWLVGLCRDEQVIPSLQEYLVRHESIFDDPHVILERHRLLKYKEEPVPSHLNSFNHPMLAETYNHFADQFFDSAGHRLRRENWLWDEFVRIYFPQLIKLCYSIFQYRHKDDAAADQRNIVRQHYQERWLYWLKWRKYLLDFEGPPAELVFCREYKSYHEAD